MRDEGGYDRTDDGARAEKIEIIAQALLRQFGDRAPAIVRRQGEAATAQARRTWAAILIRVNGLLAASQV